MSEEPIIIQQSQSEAAGAVLETTRESSAGEAAAVVQEAEALLRVGNEHEFHVLVIGAGPGGYVAAIRAAQLGGKVALVERDALGGTCLNRGCIPTKALLESAEALRSVKRAREFGIEVGPVSFDYAKMVQRVQRVVKNGRSGLGFLMEKNNVTVIEGSARFTAPHQVAVALNAGGTRAVDAASIIIAAGSSPVRPPIPGVDCAGVVTSDELLEMTTLPDRMVVVGAGSVGVEFAVLFHDLGTKVTLLEMLPAILPHEDRDVSAELTKILERNGLSIVTGARVTNIELIADDLAVAYDHGGRKAEVAGDLVLLAVGRKAETDALGLEEAGIECDRANIIVNNQQETNVRGVYAIGDAVRGIGLAHTAMAEGQVAAENAMGRHKAINRELIPSCVYIHPEVASIGCTEQFAESEGLAIRVGKFSFRASGRAATRGERDGFAKVIARADDETIIGIHLLGPRATDLIAEAALILRFGMTVTELADTIHAHPTFAEAIVEAALATRGESIHQ